ncbi:MAG: hypothetical protein CM15mV114_400 [Caudoviricetes sp.]|nr:MAG: hypothetical protein CM15mV114_400 [Caudoviricetes sp.]
MTNKPQKRGIFGFNTRTKKDYKKNLLKKFVKDEQRENFVMSKRKILHKNILSTISGYI